MNFSLQLRQIRIQNPEDFSVAPAFVNVSIKFDLYGLLHLHTVDGTEFPSF